MAEEEPDREAKTPNNTGSFAVFHDESRRLANRLQTIALFKEQVLAALDIGGARRARDLAKRLNELADRFAIWPELATTEEGAQVVQQERSEKVAQLLDAQREVEEMAAATPGLPAAEKRLSAIRRR